MATPRLVVVWPASTRKEHCGSWRRLTVFAPSAFVSNQTTPSSTAMATAPNLWTLALRAGSQSVEWACWRRNSATFPFVVAHHDLAALAYISALSYRRRVAVTPPSIEIPAPLMYADSSLARKT